MATNRTNIPPLNLSNKDVADTQEEEEDYFDIDMELMNSSSSSSTSSSPPEMIEFEFQMNSTTCKEKEPSTCPADDLFYRGNLLPLHLPPRLQMVQKLLQTTIQEDPKWSKSSTAPSTNTTTTPLHSCNISPSESCRVSCELNPQDFPHFEWSSDLSTFIISHPKKSWSKKLKLVKKSLITSQKIRDYIKGLFIKSAGESFPNNQEPPLPHHPTIATVLKNGDKDEIEENVMSNHRRSFSAAIKRTSKKSLSSSSSFSSSSCASSSSSSSSSSSAFISNGVHELKRISSDTSEIENSIEAAIAHCRKSQEPCKSSKPLLLRENKSGISSILACST
ncbi:unnamed protein product [Cuscuta europaea]|uniref:Membrane-associated kinase regulator 4 n=1 Tax=Cuscuta europaea TaxID=41803 RepID=A0A9P0Z973_CUSEU|nr:unnamed protein product [Cuscuta europaea]